MFNRISPQALEVLKALSYFHFLTNNHLVELNVAASAHSLNAKALKELVPPRDDNGNVRSGNGRMRSKYLCNNLRFGGIKDGSGKKQVKVAYLHYLTERGRKFLYWALNDEIEALGEDFEIWIPKPNDTLSNDYFHRCNYVYAHIYLRRWAQLAGAEIDFFTHYYQANPNRSELRGHPPSINQVIWNPQKNSAATPDGLCGITHNGKSRLFVVEMHRHTETKRVIDQLYRNMRATAAIRAKFPDYPTTNDPFVLSIYTEPTIMAAVRKRISRNPSFAPVLKGLLFASLEDLKSGFADAWKYADGTAVNLFR